MHAAVKVWRIMALIATWCLSLALWWGQRYLKRWRFARPKNYMMRGRLLVHETIMRPQQRNQFNQVKAQWPAYKFYTPLFQELLELQRLHGADVAGPWQELRECLAKDIAIEEVLHGHIKNAAWQLLFMAISVWVPMLMITMNAGLKTYNIITFPLVAAILVLQTCGALWWWHWPKKQRQKCFDFLGPIAQCLLSLQVLAAIAMDINNILRRCQYSTVFENIPKHINGPWHAIHQQLLQTIQYWRQHGQSPVDELRLMNASLWVGHQQQLELFKRRLDQGQLAVTAVCFVGSYLLFVAALMGGLIRQL
jgi:hypothetical protein